MSGIRKDEFGFMRSSGYGRITLDQIRRELGAGDDEVVYQSSNRSGVRSSEVVRVKDVDYKHGDTFNAGPQIVKAAWPGMFRSTSERQGTSGSFSCQQVLPAGEELNQTLKSEMVALKRAGFGGIKSPERVEWGWSLSLRGMALPGGTRTDAMILLPRNYPYASPIGFYLREGAALGGLDTGHLYDDAYHGAIDITEHGWQWFCGIAEGWKPGRHNLVTYLSMVQTMLAEKSM